jgi:hypothetical protein
MSSGFPVIPAKAGIHTASVSRSGAVWTPAFAGVTAGGQGEVSI